MVDSADLMMNWLCNLIFIDSCRLTSKPSIVNHLVSHAILFRLSLLISSPYIVERCLLRKLATLNSQDVSALLDIFWMFLEKQQLYDCLEHLVRALVNG